MDLFELAAKITMDSKGFVSGIETASKKMSNFASDVGKLTSDIYTKVSGIGEKVAGAVTSAVSVAATGVSALTTAAVNNYADYEQLVGGVDTLFKEASVKVQEYAANAYRTAGISANDYMETVTSFSASLLQSLGGNTKAAAELANQAITDMADNANKMGTDMSSIQAAYQNFAKQNYSLLDNLKLGYGGSQKEMYRLLQTAAELDEEFAKTAEFSLDAKGSLTAGYDDIVKAIHIVQTEMGITGTTAKEASETISGSLSSAKAAWENLTVAFADGNQDLSAQIDILLESVGTAANNIIPRVETALTKVASLAKEKAADVTVNIIEGLSEIPAIADSVFSFAKDLVSQVSEAVLSRKGTLTQTFNDVFSGAMEALSSITTKILPLVSEFVSTLVTSFLSFKGDMFSIGLDVLTSIISGIANNIGKIVVTAKSVLQKMSEGITQNLPIIIQSAVTIINSLASGFMSEESISTLFTSATNILMQLVNGIISSLPVLMQSAVNIIAALGNWLGDPEMLKGLLESALTIIKELGYGLMDAIPQLVESAMDIIVGLCSFLTDPENILKLVWTAVELVVALASGLISAIPQLLAGVAELTGNMAESIRESVTDFKQIGEDIVNGLWDGIKRVWESLKRWFSDAWNDLVGGVKDLLGIHSPSRVFAGIGKNMALGVGEGWSGEFAKIKDEIDGDMNLGDKVFATNQMRGIHHIAYKGGASAGRAVNVTQNIYSRAMTAADLMEEAMYEQERAVLMGV